MQRRILILMTIGAFVGTLALVGGLTNRTSAADSPQLLAQTTPPPETNSPPSGTLTLKGGSVALGIGYTWGGGNLDFQGSQHAFKVSGLSVVNVGATEITGAFSSPNHSRSRSPVTWQSGSGRSVPRRDSPGQGPLDASMMRS